MEPDEMDLSRWEAIRKYEERASMLVTHFASREQIEGLFHLFAKPFDHHGNLDWVAPAWWHLMMATAKH